MTLMTIDNIDIQDYMKLKDVQEKYGIPTTTMNHWINRKQCPYGDLKYIKIAHRVRVNIQDIERILTIINA